MTDKQIMIDGIDVSGCLFHSLTTMGYAGYNYCKCFQCVCECHRDCHYKLYKRKEQECEILLGQLVINDGEDVTVQISQSQFEEYNQLKTELNIKEQECEMFKRALKNKTDEYNKLAVNYDAYVYMAKKKLQEKEQECEELKEEAQYLKSEIERISEQ